MFIARLYLAWAYCFAKRQTERTQLQPTRQHPASGLVGCSTANFPSRVSYPVPYTSLHHPRASPSLLGPATCNLQPVVRRSRGTDTHRSNRCAWTRRVPFSRSIAPSPLFDTFPKRDPHVSLPRLFRAFDPAYTLLISDCRSLAWECMEY